MKAAVRMVLVEDGFELLRETADSIGFLMHYVMGEIPAWIHADEEYGARLQVTAPVRAPEESRVAVAEAVARANYGLMHGTIQLDMDDGELGVRDAVIAVNGVVDEQAIRMMIYAGIGLFDRYMLSILTVADGNATPIRAIAEAEADKGGDDDDGDDGADGAVNNEPSHDDQPDCGVGVTLPVPNSYRVGNSLLFAGEYPYAASAAEGAARLDAFLASGITSFVDLTLPADGLAPYEPTLMHLAWERRLDVRYFDMGFRDMGVPDDPEHVRRILNIIAEQLAEGRATYVHCWGGVGRTGLVVGCHLVDRGMSGDDALQTVQLLFETMSPAKVARHRSWGSPQTEEQRRFVREWERHRPRLSMQRQAELLLPMGWTPPAGVLPTTGSTAGAILQRRDRIRGALIGLAVGDALGATNEFKAPGTFVPISDMAGAGPHRLKPGEWTDDTSMALCLADSLIERRELNPADQLGRYVRWMQDGYLSSNGRCFDVGITTRAALHRFMRDGSLAANHDRATAGNGALMRLAPVPMLYWQSAAQAIEAAGASSLPTHSSPLSVDACRYLAALIIGAIRGASKEELLAPFYSPVPGMWEQAPLEPEVAAIAAGSFRHRQPPAIRGTGYCVDSLEAALWAFHSSNDFRTGALLAVNLGDDADTTGAIYGQLAGAFYGESQVPAGWRALLAHHTTISHFAEMLFQLSLDMRPELSSGRKQQARELESNAVASYGSAGAALDAITRQQAAERAEMGALQYFMSGSMGEEAAKDEALLLLRVELGLHLIEQAELD